MRASRLVLIGCFDVSSVGKYQDGSSGKRPRRSITMFIRLAFVYRGRIDLELIFVENERDVSARRLVGRPIDRLVTGFV